MAQDDMHVVMYKILSYLYDCMKSGVEPNRSLFAHDSDMLGIPRPYWVAVMVELSERKLVKGVGVLRGSNSVDIALHRPTVTLEGVEFIQENSMMRKAYNFLKDAKALLPFMS